MSHQCRMWCVYAVQCYRQSDVAVPGNCQETCTFTQSITSRCIRQLSAALSAAIGRTGSEKAEQKEQFVRRPLRSKPLCARDTVRRQRLAIQYTHRTVDGGIRPAFCGRTELGILVFVHKSHCRLLCYNSLHQYNDRFFLFCHFLPKKS